MKGKSDDQLEEDVTSAIDGLTTQRDDLSIGRWLLAIGLALAGTWVLIAVVLLITWNG